VTVPETSPTIGAVTGLDAEVSPPPSSAAHWRLLARLAGDVLAVGIGMTVFSLHIGRVSESQLFWAVGYVLIAAVIDATHVRKEWSLVEEFVLAMKVAVVALVLTATGGLLVNGSISRILLLSVSVAMLIARPLTTLLLDRGSLVNSAPFQRLLVICSDDEYQELCITIGNTIPRRVRIIGRVSESQAARDLVQTCKSLSPTRVVVGDTPLRDVAFLEQVTAVNEMGTAVRSFPSLFEEEFGRIPLVSLETSWFLFDIGPLHRLRYRLVRRLIDIASGSIALAIYGLAFPFVAVAIKLDSPGPVLFRQTRVGQGGRRFSMLKFRTMHEEAESDGPRFAMRSDDRITRIGHLLRRSRIDELPQAINLLRGDMSLIGPRPERPEWVTEYERSIPFYSKRTLIKPGLTGWAQVHEGYSASTEDTVRKLERDLYYLRNQSMGLDLRILMATVGRVASFAGR
jgi:exopolysaccharide biosynthesis polyprenyl glycosylphosphotransferase